MREVSRKRRWLWALIPVCLILIGAVAFAMRPRTLAVSTTAVTRKTLANQIFASGSVKPTDRQIVMPQQLQGPITMTYVQVGDHVHVGETLIQCDNTAQAAALSAAKVAVQQAQSALSETQHEASAAPAGFQSQFAGTLAQQQASLAQAKAQLSQAQAAYDATRIQSKLDGTVIILNPEGLAADGTSSPILEVVGTGKQVVVNVSEVDAVHIQPGMKAVVSSDAYPNQEWNAVVERVADFAAASASGTGQVEVDLTSTGEMKIPLGYQVDVHITTATKQQVPVVPYAAIVQNGSQYAVFVVSGTRVHKQSVELGITTDTEVEVSKGLHVGDKVVVNPPESLRDGDKVNVHD